MGKTLDFHFRAAFILLALLAKGAITPAFAETFSVDFTDPSYFDNANSTGLWNISLGQIQPAVAPGGVAGEEVDFGDGRDGAFSDGPAQAGISVSGTTITFNTNVKAEFQFTTFNLSAGYTARAVGSRPLVIRVMGTTTIAGTLHANGSPGANNGISGNPAGGTGGASGGSGGRGDSPAGDDGTDGSPASGTPAGGGSGTWTSTSTFDFGGGGGCNGSDGGAFDALGGNADTAANEGSCAGTYSSIASSFETTFRGGGGGGGGGGFDDGSNVFSGAGGGGAGGAIRLISLDAVSITGSINATGGAGGNNDTGNGADCGGGGGGGSGGSIWIQTASTVGGAGTLDVSGGSGGTNTTCFAYEGGAGSRGVFRADSSSGSHSITTVSPTAVDLQNSVSTPAGQSYVVTSSALDFSDGYYSFTAPVETLGCGAVAGDISIVYQGSQDGSHWSSGVSGTNIDELREYAYLRFKATFNTATACLSGLSIDYTLRDVSELELEGGGLFCAPPANAGFRKAPVSTSALGDFLFLLVSIVLARLFFTVRRPT